MDRVVEMLEKKFVHEENVMIKTIMNVLFVNRMKFVFEMKQQRYMNVKMIFEIVIVNLKNFVYLFILDQI